MADYTFKLMGLDTSVLTVNYTPAATAQGTEGEEDYVAAVDAFYYITKGDDTTEFYQFAMNTTSQKVELVALTKKEDATAPEQNGDEATYSADAYELPTGYTALSIFPLVVSEDDGVVTVQLSSNALSVVDTSTSSTKISVAAVDTKDKNTYCLTVAEDVTVSKFNGTVTWTKSDDGKTYTGKFSSAANTTKGWVVLPGASDLTYSTSATPFGKNKTITLTGTLADEAFTTDETTDKISTNYIDFVGATVVIKAGLLPGSYNNLTDGQEMLTISTTTTLNNCYIDSAVQAITTAAQWEADDNGITCNYMSESNNAGYINTDKGTTIYYKAEVKSDTLLTMTGLTENVELDGSEVSKNDANYTVTLNAARLKEILDGIDGDEESPVTDYSRTITVKPPDNANYQVTLALTTDAEALNQKSDKVKDAATLAIDSTTTESSASYTYKSESYEPYYEPAEDNLSLTVHTATGQKEFTITGLKSGLTLATVYLDKAGKIVDTATTETTEKVVGLTDGNNIVVRFGDYDEYVNSAAENKTIGEFDDEAGEIRISKDALATPKTDVIFTAKDISKIIDDSVVNFTFGGLVKGERTNGTDSYFVSTAPTSAVSFTEETGTGKYVFESSHTPEYFETGTATKDNETGDTVTTSTYHAATDYKTFTIDNLESGLTKDDVAVDSAESGKKVYITLPTATEDGTIKLEAGALPTGDESVTISLSDMKEFESNAETGTAVTFNLALGEDVNTSDTVVAENSSAKLETVDGGSLKYTAPTYKAYYVDDDTNNTVTYNPERGGDAFTVSGLNTELATRYTTVDGTTGLLTGLDEILEVDGDNHIVTFKNPEWFAGADDVLRFTNGTGSEFAFKLGSDIKIESGGQTSASYEQDGDTVTYTAAIQSHEYFEEVTKGDNFVQGSTTYLHHAQDGGETFIIGGLTTTELSNDDLKAAVVVDESAKTVTLNYKILPGDATEGLIIKLESDYDIFNDYDLKLATDDATKAITATDTYGSFELKDDKYTFTAAGTTEGYVADEDAHTISYQAQTGRESFSVTGLKDNLAVTGTAGNLVTAQLVSKGISIGEESGGTVIVTVDGRALDGKDVAFQDDDPDDGITYELAFAESGEYSVATSEESATVKGSFTKIENGTATYTATKIGEYYAKESDTDSIQYKYTAEDTPAGKTFTITGLRSTTTAAKQMTTARYPLPSRSKTIPSSAKATSNSAPLRQVIPSRLRLAKTSLRTLPIIKTASGAKLTTTAKRLTAAADTTRTTPPCLPQMTQPKSPHSSITKPWTLRRNLNSAVWRQVPTSKTARQ